MIIELIFILIYGSILGLMAPYILPRNESVGVLLAPAIALAYGFASWTISTWFGLSSSDYWIWIISMIGMPAAMIIGVQVISRRRINHEAA
ncbi:MAG: hypothetical protein JHD31_00695 [Rhodoluna sp.]|jgi:uncharacterized membrane protein YeaQ/YmgE (transglycosylase-associated protein family)|nr:hypothetical protein [Rhodoluna sp.]